MGAQKLLNQKYQNLCQKLGDLEYQRHYIQQTIDKLKSEIFALNSIAPDVALLEKNIKVLAAQEVANVAQKASESV